MKYIKKVEVQAMYWDGYKSFDELYKFFNADYNLGVVGTHPADNDIAQIRTDNGIIDVNKGNYIVAEHNGDVYQCNEDVFNREYENAYIN